MAEILIHRFAETHREAVRQLLVEHFHEPNVASKGELRSALDLPGFVATEDRRCLGHVAYIIADDQCEVVVLGVGERWRGIGTRLVDAVEEEARRRGCTRLWLTTTNDNLEALRFYQRRGFVLCRLYAEGVKRSRAVKPAIPEIGRFDIPIRDEIELEKRL